MSAAILVRSVLTASLAIAAVLALHRVQGTITFVELLLAAGFASLLCSVGSSLFRDPRQFARALFERIRYLVVVPICAVLVIGLILFRIGFVLFKIAFKAFAAFALWLIYLVFPIDLIPDLIPVVGLIDDFALLATVVVWAICTGWKAELRSTMTILRPETPFP